MTETPVSKTNQDNIVDNQQLTKVKIKITRWPSQRFF